MQKAKQWAGLLLLMPSLLGISVFYVAPLFISLYYSTTQGISNVRFVGLQNFQELCDNPVFLQATQNTILFLMIAVPLVIALAFLFSLIMVKRKFTWQQWALLLPLVIPASSLSIGWKSLWDTDGLANSLLIALGLQPVDFLYGTTAFPLLICLYLLKNSGYLCVILTSSIRSIPVEYQECYRLDSNSELGFVHYILLPTLTPTVLFCAIVAIMNYFLLFRDTYMIYSDAPPAQVYMLQHFMNTNFYKLNYQRLSCAAFLTALFLFILIGVVLVAQRRLKKHVE